MLDTSKVKRKVDAAAAVIVKEGENGEKLLLLIQRAKDDHWPLHFEFPRGKCDKGHKQLGENLISCCKREVKEETGLDVEPIFKIDEFQYVADKGTRLTTCHNFFCKMKDPEQKIKLSNEHENYKWIQSIGEAEMLVHPDQKKTIQKIFNRGVRIVNHPENFFTKNNTVEEYLNHLCEKNGYIDKVYKLSVNKLPAELKLFALNWPAYAVKLNKNIRPMWGGRPLTAQKVDEIHKQVIGSIIEEDEIRSEHGGRLENQRLIYEKLLFSFYDVNDRGPWFYSFKDKKIYKHQSRDENGFYVNGRLFPPIPYKEWLRGWKEAISKGDDLEIFCYNWVTKKMITSGACRYILKERQWDEETDRPDLFKIDRFKDLMKFDKTEDDFNDERHSVQPTLLGLIATAGGDYKGREDMANSKYGSFSGIDKLKKYLPKDWQKKLRKYAELQAKKGRD